MVQATSRTNLHIISQNCDKQVPKVYTFIVKCLIKNSQQEDFLKCCASKQTYITVM